MSLIPKRAVKFAYAVRRTYRTLRSSERRFLRMPPGHFYSPLPSDDDVRRALATAPGGVLPGLPCDLDEQLRVLAELAPHAREWPFPARRTAEFRYYSENGYFAKPDGVVLYAMLRQLRPAQIVEIGSGFSSALMLDAGDLHPDCRARLTFIDPHPERLRQLLRPEDWQRCTVTAARVQDVDLGVFERLQSGDIMFIDSSHVSKAGSDVNFLVLEVLPRLAPGVAVHLHDMFWPFEYPSEWYANGLAWNEAYLMRSFLMFNSAYRIRLWLSQLQALRGAETAAIWPDPRPCSGEASGLWLVRQ